MSVVIRQSQFITGQLSTITGDCAGDVVVNEYFYDLPTAQNLTGDIIEIGVLPAYHKVTEMILAPDDMDSSTGMLLDVGLMSGTPGDSTNTRTCGAEFYSASTLGQSGTAARPTLKTAYTVLPTEADRSIGVKINTQSTTAVAGRVRLTVFMHPADHKTQY